jgi:hypothetical protein
MKTIIFLILASLDHIHAIVTVYETVFVTSTIFINYATPNPEPTTTSSQIDATPTSTPATGNGEVIYSGEGLGTYYFDITG